MWAILQAEGLAPPGLSNPAFGALVTRTLDDPGIGPLLRPLATIVQVLDRQVPDLDREIAGRARASAARRRLMTVPGVGPLVALTYASGLDDPTRFHGSRTVGAHFGLAETPSARGGRRVLCGSVVPVTPPCAVLCINQGRERADPRDEGSGRRDVLADARGAVRVPRRRGLGRAKVALTRKLAVVLHKLWTSGEDDRATAAG